MTSFFNKSSRLLKYSSKINFSFKTLIASSHFESLGLSSYTTSLGLSVRHPQQFVALIPKHVFCPLCGCINPGFRSLSTSQICAKKKKERKPIVFSKKSDIKPVPIWKNMTVKDLANSLEKTVDELYEVFLYVEGTDEYDRSTSVMSDLKIIQKVVKIIHRKFVIKAPDPGPSEDQSAIKNAFKSPPAPPEELEPRPPIVTIMGHVDHGKTTLLDNLRHSSIVDTEFGGITQHIGAFEVSLPNGQQVTFLDTPGHAAFSAMRARGASVTDIIVLVVAVEDGVLQQTKESADLARESNTPVVVAINKIDKSGADIRKCEESLLTLGLQPESMGGDVQVVPISALKGTNVPLLVEALVTQAEVLDLRATRRGHVEGAVIESEVNPRRGKIATCIVQRGTLTKGACIVAETAWAKVRSLFSSSGKPIEKALPGMPVQVIGWKDKLPPAGAELLEVDGERRAREVVSFRENELKKLKGEKDFEVIQEKMAEHLKTYREQLEAKWKMGFRRKMTKGRPPLEKQIKDDPHPRVSIVVKGDVDGSLDAILDVLDTYESDECLLHVLSYGVGNVTPGDIEMAKTFQGIIYAFNVPLQKDIKFLAMQNEIHVREHNVIYRLIEDLQAEISKQLPPKPEEEIVGEALVQQEFMVSEGRKKVPIAGCRCVRGQLKKGESFKLVRTSEVIHEGEVSSMRHLKKEIETINKDVECGIMFADTTLRFEPGDMILCYRMKMVQKKTDWSPDGF